MPNLERLEATVEIWKRLYESASGAPPSSYTREKLEEARGVFEALGSVADECIRVSKGLGARLPAAHPGTLALFCFISKFAPATSIDELPTSAAERLGSVLENTFLLGLLTHVVAFNSPVRKLLPGVDPARVFHHWSDQAPIADIGLKQYNREVAGMPKDVFEAYYNPTVEALLKSEFHVGFWKRGWSVRSYFRNLYFSGCSLGLIGEIEANKLAEST